MLAAADGPMSELSLMALDRYLYDGNATLLSTRLPWAVGGDVPAGRVCCSRRLTVCSSPPCQLQHLTSSRTTSPTAQVTDKFSSPHHRCIFLKHAPLA